MNNHCRLVFILAVAVSSHTCDRKQPSKQGPSTAKIGFALDGSESPDPASAVVEEPPTTSLPSMETDPIASTDPTVRPCPMLPGTPHPLLGSGACTGNLLVEAFIGSSATWRLNYNSAEPTLSQGFGNGWNLDVLWEIQLRSGSTPQLIDGKRTRYAFESTSETNQFKLDDPRLPRMTLELRVDRTSARMVLSDQRVMEFATVLPNSSRLMIVSSANRTPQITKFEYQNGIISKITLPDNRSVTFDTFGTQVNGVTDEVGVVTTFSHANGSLMTIRNADGTSTKFEYSSPTTFSTHSGLLTAVKKVNGKTVRYEYDQAGRLSAQLNESNYRTNYRYKADEVVVFDDFGYVKESLVLQRVAAIDHNGVVTRLTRDPSGRIIASVDALGQRTEYTYTDASHRPSVVSSSDGSVRSTTYDAEGRIVTDSISKNGQTRSQTDIRNAKGDVIETRNGNLVTKYERNPMGQITRITDPFGRILQEKTYDSRGMLTSSTDLAGITTTYAYDGYRLTSSTDHLLRQTTYQYDSFGRLVSKQTPDGMVQTLSYDSMANVIENSFNRAGVKQTVRTIENRNAAGLLSSAKTVELNNDSIVRSMQSDFDVEGPNPTQLQRVTFSSPSVNGLQLVDKARAGINTVRNSTAIP